jgi:hypothetical protein
MSSAADAIKRYQAEKRADQLAMEADNAAFPAAAEAAINARIPEINRLAKQIVDATDREAAMRIAFDFDFGWNDFVVERILPGAARASSDLQQRDNYRPSARYDIVKRAKAADRAASQALRSRFNGVNPIILGQVIDKKYGAGSYVAWINAVMSPSWWDSVGVPIISAVLFAYVSAGLMDGLNTYANGGVAAESGAVVESGVSVGGLQTGISTGVGALDSLIGAAITGAIVPQQNATPSGAVAPSAAPAQPAVTAANQSTSWLPYLAIGAAILGAVL